MDNSLLGLRGEDVGGVGCKPIDWRRTLLEGGFDGGRGLQFVEVDAYIFGDGCVGRLRLGQNRGNESFGQHGKAISGIVSRRKVVQVIRR